MEKDFCKFLTKIGMIDEDTALTFLKIYNDIQKENSDINIFELSFQILITFLNNITNIQKNYMCHNLPSKFYEIHEKNKKDKLISIIMKKRLKDKIFLLKYIFLWKNKAMNIRKKISSNSKKDINSFNKNNTSFKKTNQNTSNNNIYKIPYPKNMSNINYLDDKLNNITDQEYIFLDNNLSNKSNSQSFLNNTMKNNTNSEIKINYNGGNYINYKELNKSSSRDKIRNKNKSKNINNSHSINDVNTTWGYKEQEELKECTFKPKINNLKHNITPSKISYKQREKELQSRFNKLYNDNEKYKIAKQIKALEWDYLKNKELTFNPNINCTPNLIRDKRRKNFEKRIKSYLEIKNKHSDDIINKINEEFNKTHSFSPKINKSYSNNEIYSKTYFKKNESENNNITPAYIRLYEERKLRNKKFLVRQKEKDECINNLSSSLIKKISVVDFNKINELYENKQKIKINERTKNKVENEEGITFKPFIYKNKFAKNICSNFYERNSRFLEDKEKYINLHQNNSNPKKKISKNEKKEIVKNIVDRLYNESKSRSRNNNECNKYIKSIQESFNNLKNYEHINYHNFNSIE